MTAEEQVEWRMEQALKKPWAERDHDPSGPDEEVLYFEVPSGWPVTRREHWEQMRRLSGLVQAA